MSDRAKILVLQRDKDALGYIKSNIKLREPTPILALRGVGKDILFEHIVLNIEKLAEGSTHRCLDITSREEFEELLLEIKDSKDKMLLVLNIGLEGDLSDLIRQLSDVRTKRDEEFNYILFLNTRHVRKLLVSKDKAVYRNLYVYKPLNREDSFVLFKEFERRFSLSLDVNQLEEINKLCRGHVGLMKSLYLAVARDGLKLDDDLLNNPHIIHRLETTLLDAIEEISRKSLYENRWILELLGFIKDNKIFSPLFDKYFQQLISKEDSIESKLSYAEKKVFTILKQKQGEIVSRDEVAQVLWGQEWSEKYSDWAIDQTIYRIRKNLELSPYKLITRKGEGFAVEFC